MYITDIVEIRDEILTRRPGIKVAFRKLYTATNPEDLYDFHNKCDGKGPTLTVLYGKNDVVFGGYTTKDWMKSKRPTHIEDSDAFLFVNKKNERCQILKLCLNHRDRAITRYCNYGPTFGGGRYCWQGYDLQTFHIDKKSESEMKDGNLILNGTMNLNFAYKSEDSTFSSETVNGGTLDVNKIEVYQVIDYVWREKPEDTNERKYLKKLRILKDENRPFYNILLIGNVGVGKSSICNTLATAMSGKITCVAQTGSAESSRSVTNQFKVYRLLTAKDKDINVRMFDTRGLSHERNFSTELEIMLNGKLKFNFRFPDQSGIPVPLNEQTTITDTMDLVCLVVDVMTFKLVQSNPQYQSNQRHVLETTRKLEIPLVCVATKTDKLCPTVHKNADDIYQSLTVSEAVKAIAEEIGIEEKHVFPVVNYANDTQISHGKDSLAIHALYSMIKRIEDYLKYDQGASRPGKVWSLQECPKAQNSENDLGSDSVDVIYVGEEQ